MIPTILDWTGSEHWSHDRKPCLHCGQPTNLRDNLGRPAMKVCAEALIDQRRHLRAVAERRSA